MGTKWMLVLVMALWGGSFIASDIGLDGLPGAAAGTMFPVELATLRFAIATPVLLLLTVALCGWRSLIVDRKHLPVLFVLAMTGVTLQYILQLFAMKMTSVTNTVLLINMGTFFVLIPSALFLKVRFTADNVLGVALAFAGAALIVTKGDFGLTASLAGDGLVLGSALLWAIYVLIGNRLAGKVSVLTQLNYIFIVGFLGLLPFYAMTDRHAITTLSPTSWACLLYLALVCSIVAYFFFNDAIVKIGPAQTAIYQYFEPLFGIAFAILLLGEQLTIAIGLGALLVVAGIAMADNNLKVVGRFLKGAPPGPAEGHH